MSIAESFSYCTSRHSFFLGEIVDKWTLMLPGAGCEYWKKTGGCKMCGFHVATHSFTRGHLLPSIAFSIIYKLAQRATSALKPRELSIYNGGSFWNPREIPIRFQEKLFYLISAHPDLKKVLIETRPEFIKEEKIKSAISALGDKSLTVAMGFESQDDFIRNSLIKKGISRKEYERKVDLLRNNGARSLAYVFLKPGGLSERRALREAVETIRYVLSVGADEVELSCAFVQEKTPLALDYMKGTFKPPSLWTIIEIIKEAEKAKWPLQVGSFSDEPPPVAAPDSCEKCSFNNLEAIEQYRVTGHLGEISDCECKREWERMM